jgi:hypothetical protein
MAFILITRRMKKKNFFELQICPFLSEMANLNVCRLGFKAFFPVLGRMFFSCFSIP